MNQLCKYGEIEVITGKTPVIQKRIIEEILGPHKFSHYIPPHNVGVMYISDDEILAR